MRDTESDRDRDRDRDRQIRPFGKFSVPSGRGWYSHSDVKNVTNIDLL